VRSPLTLSALVIASLVGSTFVASAQTQPAPGVSSQGNVGPGATEPMKPANGMNTGPTTTTGSDTRERSNMGNGTGRPTDRGQSSQSSQGNVGPGTNKNNN
jgi:hypothetical protein